MAFKTEQEQFWAGEFGNEYIQRNADAKIIAGNLNMFSQVLRSTTDIRSVIEFGANIGNNLKALAQLRPEAELSAIEINEKAVGILKENKKITVHHTSILDFTPQKKYDLVLIKGVLIHLAPEVLPQVYELLYRTSGAYICVAEYYNPSPIAIPYRGHTNKLFKRDFAGEMMDAFKDLELVSYGFGYHRDPNFPMDDITWFLLKKKGV
jgi:pseudaminic acid biosynthesis-associated methylase